MHEALSSLPRFNATRRQIKGPLVKKRVMKKNDMHGQEGSFSFSEKQGKQDETERRTFTTLQNRGDRQRERETPQHTQWSWLTPG